MMVSLLHNFHELYPHWKVVVATTVAAVTATLDAVAPPGGWEDIGLKAALAGALLFVVRLLLKQQEEHKRERDEREAKFAAERVSRELEFTAERIEREAKLMAALNRNAESMDQLTSLTKEQTDYFKSVTRNIVDQHIKGPGHLP